MAPLTVYLAMFGLTTIVLICLGTQISIQSLRESALKWRPLLAVCLGQWIVLPAMLFLYLQMHGGSAREALAIAVVGIAPAGVFACTALYLIGIRITTTLLVAVLFLETVGMGLLSAMLDLLVLVEDLPGDLLDENLARLSRVQIVVIALPLLIGFGLRWLMPQLGAMLSKLTALMIWLSYAAIIAFALSLKAHFSYRVDILQALPEVLAMIASGVLAGLVVYLISAYLLRYRGTDLIAISVLIAMQGPAPALRLTTMSRDTWPELAAIAISYALVLPVLAAIWVLLSKTRWGGVLLPR